MSELQLVLVALVAVVFLLACGLVLANRTMSRTIDHTQRFNLACLKHALAESLNQREMLRMEFDSHHQELLLREARARDAAKNHRAVPPDDTKPPTEPMIPIEANNLA